MKVAILGATGAVGRMILKVLEDREFPMDELVLLASDRSDGKRMTFRGTERSVRTVSAETFDGCRCVIFSAGSGPSREWAPAAVEAGAIVVDNSSAWRMEPDVPLVVPEVNAHRLRNAARGIIANPNCVTIQLTVALEAIRRVAGLRRVIVSTYQAVSGAGERGSRALLAELRDSPTSDSPFPAPIRDNVIPAVGEIGDSGWSGEERKIRVETRKILELPELSVAATCVRVPVAMGHAASVTVETARPLDADGARLAFRDMPGIRLADRPFGPLPREIAGTDIVGVGRIRDDADQPNTLHFWVVADNLRKGAATNAVQIAERLVRG